MANDSALAAGKSNFPNVMRGQVIGGAVGYTLLAGTLALIYGPRTGSEWNVATFLIGWIVGGAVGGAWQLRRAKRSAEIGKFLAQQLLALLLVVPIVAAAVIGGRTYGNAGWWIGLIGSCLVVFGGMVLYAMLKSSGGDGTTVG